MCFVVIVNVNVIGFVIVLDFLCSMVGELQSHLLHILNKNGLILFRFFLNVNDVVVIMLDSVGMILYTYVAVGAGVQMSRSGILSSGAIRIMHYHYMRWHGVRY